ncbi:imm11 family protein [Formosa sp. PL04]|uniref:imm11 family protein n=1 Tax=Formosa sp. PL04 TaxID=3081755 RepID=UPI002981FC8B|nr:DUF1629 domain-containing protein [Formosa sp. PL04]MDW5289557.1 hypothetical protein [Formosa sp. PL04]
MKLDPEIIDPATTIDSGSLDPLELIDGKILPEVGKLNITLSPRSNDDRGDLIPGLVTLFHDELIGELNRLGVDNIQCLPVNLHAPNGDIEGGYSIANIIGLLDAVDLGKSKLDEKIPGIRQTLYSFSIDKVKAKGLHIFRILHAPSLIIVDEWLKEQLIEFEVQGVIMTPTEDYNGWS